MAILASEAYRWVLVVLGARGGRWRSFGLSARDIFHGPLAQPPVADVVGFCLEPYRQICVALAI